MAVEVKKDIDIDLSTVSQDTLNYMIKYGKPSNKLLHYQGERLINLSYRSVKRDIPNAIKEGRIKECILIILGHSYKRVNIEKASGNDILRFLIWVINEIEFIKNIESKHLYSKPEPEMIAAGINSLDTFSELPIIDSLASGDVLKHDMIGDLPYYKIYEKLKLDKTNLRIQKQYLELVKHKK